MTHESSSATLLNFFDIQVDSNHQWGEPVRNVEISVYEVVIDAEGEISTDTLTSLVHMEIHNAEVKCEDTWISSEDPVELAKLPERWQIAVRKAIETAQALQDKPSDPILYGRDQTVFVPEYKFPADVQFLTTDGRYVLELANSGVLDIFAQDEIEPYDTDRWNRD